MRLEDVFFFQAEDGIRDHCVTGVQTCALPIFAVVDDYMAYFRGARDRFLAFVADAPVFPPVATYPEPVDHCDVCRWAAECAQRRRSDDHLSLVAGISSRQRRALESRGVATLETLGELPVPVDPPIEGVGASALVRVREQ